MPASRGKFQCGHRAYGARCPRCVDADRIAGKAEKAKLAGKTVLAAELAEEAKRLRGPQMRGKRNVMPTMAPPEQS